jgi:toxin ParE1/3/4
MATDGRSQHLSPLAERDLEDIWNYTARTWSVSQADKYHGDLMSAIELLSQGTRRGRDASDIRPGYLKYAVGMHLLFYLITQNHIKVIRILHQRMDAPSHLDG